VTSISAIVPATNRPDTLELCRDALLRCASPPDEVILVCEPEDANAAAARNVGARRAGSDVLLFVDSDVVVGEDAVARIRAAFDAEPDLVALFGSYDDSPAAPGVASTFRNLLHHHVHQHSPGPATTFWTGLGAVRRDAFEEVGGFDESVAFMEDIDLGMRLSSRGARIVLDPEVLGTHLKHWSVWSMVRTDFAARGVPWVRLLLRHRHSAGALNLSWRHRLSAVASILGVTAFACRRPRIALASGGALVALNRDFYTLLLRRRGPLEAGAGVALHALHHLAGAAAIPVGVAFHLRDVRRRPPE
jgi:GT2 family glycosyltransferase